MTRRPCIVWGCQGECVPNTSRCPEHARGNWGRRRVIPGAYTDSQYITNRKKLLASKPICHWCRRRPATTADHLKAVSEGGDGSLANLVPACEECNRLRGAFLGGRRNAARFQKGQL